MRATPVQRIGTSPAEGADDGSARAIPRTPYNGPGRLERHGHRAPGVLREGGVRPTRLGHAVVGSTDLATSTRFFVEGLGFKASDYIGDQGAFLRCSTEHHNVLVLAAPVNFLHHTSWQVPDLADLMIGNHSQA